MLAKVAKISSDGYRTNAAGDALLFNKISTLFVFEQAA
jgi:hypothetical protein